MFTPLHKLSDTSRVWIYQATTPFSDVIANGIREAAKEFTEQWTAHDASLKAGAEVYHNVFLVFAVDESHNDASGCSLDKKVRFVREMEQKFNLDFFDRMRIAWKSASNVAIVSFSEFGNLLESGKVNDSTLVYDNLVTTLKELRERWEVPLAHSWHRRLVVSDR
jgi:hypothetical protein